MTDNHYGLPFDEKAHAELLGIDRQTQTNGFTKLLWRNPAEETSIAKFALLNGSIEPLFDTIAPTEQNFIDDLLSA